MSTTTTTPASPLVSTFICQICRQALNPGGPPIIGEKEIERIGRMQQELFKHLSENHKTEFAYSMMIGQNFGGWLCNKYFRHSDATVIKEGEAFRLLVRQATRKVNVTDEKIEAQVRQHLMGAESSEPLSEQQATTVIQLLKTLRDMMDELPAPVTKPVAS